MTLGKDNVTVKLPLFTAEELKENAVDACVKRVFKTTTEAIIATERTSNNTLQKTVRRNFISALPFLSLYGEGIYNADNTL